VNSRGNQSHEVDIGCRYVQAVTEAAASGSKSLN